MVPLVMLGGWLAGLGSGTSLALGAGATVVKWVTSTRVEEPAPGAVLFCDLLSGIAEHSGIYVGHGQIVHLDGSGEIELVSAPTFLNRLGGMATGISIYVSCKDGKSVGSAEVAERARSMVGKRRNYGLLTDNCHQFSAGCLTGKFENPDNFLLFLKDTAENVLGANQWGDWAIDLSRAQKRFDASPHVPGLEKSRDTLLGVLLRCAEVRARIASDAPEREQTVKELDLRTERVQQQLAKIENYLLLIAAGKLLVTPD